MSGIRRFVAVSIALYVLPVLLLTFRVIPYEYRFHTLMIMTFIMVCYAALRRYSWRSMGFSMDSFWRSMVLNVMIAVAICGLLFFFFIMGLIRAPTPPSWSLFYLFYIFISCPSQEFLYRGVYYVEMEKAGLSSPAVKLIFSSLNYSFLHLFYLDLITMAATLLFGLIVGLVFHFARNIYGIMLLHVMVGVASIVTGLI